MYTVNISATMEVNMTEAGGGGARSFSIRGYIDNWHRSVQYEPWFIKLSTIDRRILWTIFISIFLLLFIIIIAAATSGTTLIINHLFMNLFLGGSSDCDNCDSVRDLDGRLYRGQLSFTRSGLQCVNWSLLDRKIHTVTVDRFPDHGLGDHNNCRNPDLSRHIWCYTSLDKNHFDFCDIPKAKKVLAPKEDDQSPNIDEACDPNITVVVENGLGISGLFVLSTLWANGRGVYVRVDFTDNKVKGDMCLSWHGRYRHWWIQGCDFIGNNGGVAWLEEDARCPYDGLTWRRGGTNDLMNKTLATNGDCLEYGKEYNGTIVPGGLGDIQMTETPMECQEICWLAQGCSGFTWKSRSIPCLLFNKVTSSTFNNQSVSGHATCKRKGMDLKFYIISKNFFAEKVGCPNTHIKITDDSCIKFLTDSPVCSEGCSRYTAMEECERSGGHLLDYLSPDHFESFSE